MIICVAFGTLSRKQTQTRTAASQSAGRKPLGSDRYDAIASDLTESGLLARGGFQPRPSDHVPSLRDGRTARAVVIVGNAGAGMWKVFNRRAPSGPNPLDGWSRAVLERVAERHDADVVMPSDGPPFAPFQRWAMRAEPVSASPLGILIHSEWGLWHGYRGALLLPTEIAFPHHESVASPCDQCVDKPCLSACPVHAFKRNQHLVDECAAHLATQEGKTCMGRGCLARHACPVGKAAYPGTEQAAFHMRAFLSERSS